MKNLVRVLVVVLLGLSVTGCELFSPKEWAAYNKRRAERGVRCYREESGYVYCEDKYGNRH